MNAFHLKIFSHGFGLMNDFARSPCDQCDVGVGIFWVESFEDVLHDYDLKCVDKEGVRFEIVPRSSL